MEIFNVLKLTWEGLGRWATDAQVYRLQQYSKHRDVLPNVCVLPQGVPPLV